MINRFGPLGREKKITIMLSTVFRTTVSGRTASTVKSEVSSSRRRARVSTERTTIVSVGFSSSCRVTTGDTRSGDDGGRRRNYCGTGVVMARVQDGLRFRPTQTPIMRCVIDKNTRSKCFGYPTVYFRFETVRRCVDKTKTVREQRCCCCYEKKKKT